MLSKNPVATEKGRSRSFRYSTERHFNSDKRSALEAYATGNVFADEEQSGENTEVSPVERYRKQISCFE